MSRIRAFSSPELIPSIPSKPEQTAEDSGLEGIGTNVRLLLKLIHDHNEASSKGVDDWKMQRVASMMTILDDVKGRIQKSQSSGKRELRRCNTDLKPNRAPRDKKNSELPSSTDDKEKAKRELSASLAARKSLEMMCSSLGKEKEIMASELSRKVQELNGMEELVSDLKAQNEMLLSKVKVCASQHKEKKINHGEEGEAQGNSALQERNKVLTEQLRKSLDGYRSLKRRYKDAQQENTSMHDTLEKIGEEVEAGLENIRRLKERIKAMDEQPVDLEEEISALEHVFEGFSMKISKHQVKQK